MYTVLAAALGDGSVDYGRRVFSHNFLTREAAEVALEFLKSLSIDAVIIEDGA